MERKRVIVIGAGFGGLNVAMGLKNANLDVLVIDKSNHHLFQPLLYQVASAALGPRDIAVPIREILKKQENTTVLMGEIIDIDKEQKFVTIDNGETFSFDYLVVAVGSHHSYFGNDHWKQFAPGLKTLPDALAIRDKILTSYEEAEKAENPEEIAKALSFVIIGGGPTGVELAGAIAEIAHATLMKNFRKIDPTDSKIYLIEGHPHLLPPYPKQLGERAQWDLEELGVTVMTDTKVTDITKDGVQIDGRFIESDNVIWAAGNQAPKLMDKLGTTLNKRRQAIVEKDLSIPDYPNIFVIGDAAYLIDKEGNPLPGIAPVAVQQGKYLAKVIGKNILKEKRKPFSYFDKGSLATIGKYRAVGKIGKRLLEGFTAWVVWCFVHIIYLVGFRNRLIVLFEWGFWYFTGKRGSRLILNSENEEHPHY